MIYTNVRYGFKNKKQIKLEMNENLLVVQGFAYIPNVRFKGKVTEALVTPFNLLTCVSILLTHDAQVIPRISISTSTSPLSGSSIISEGNPNSVIDLAIFSGVMTLALYLTSALAANRATNTLSIP
uniref:Uncharacterized protein n=1 Tax=Glossina pallidipes TaxID=7398 RepID=A0A1B0AC49_GLOPL